MVPAGNFFRPDGIIYSFVPGRPNGRSRPPVRRMRELCRRLRSGLAALVLGAVSAHAQLIRGAVLVRDDSSGVVGAVVVLLDGAGDIRARTLTDDRGRFTIRIAQPAVYRVRAMRIGLRPFTTPAVVFANDTNVVLRMSSAPAGLPPVTTREQTQCNLRPDSALALGAVWEDVKTALLATAITREKHAYRFDLVDHVRTYDYATGELRGVRMDEAQLYDSHTWASLPAEELRRIGYVIQDQDSTTFVAPDIETLLSNYFIETHCFRFASNPVADSLLAVEFAPAGRVKHAEVRGTLWIDKRTHELRSVSFRYVNLLAADSIAGGDVQFARLSTGAWVMTDWSIRAPVLRLNSEQQVSGAAIASGRRANRFSTPLVVGKHTIVTDQLRAYGGTLEAVWRDSVLLWSPPKRALELRVTRGFARTPPVADETTVYLIGTTRWLDVDSTGSVRFENLVHGDYIVDVGTRQLDVLGWPRSRVQVEIGRAPVELAEVNLASPLDAARTVCGDDAKLLSDRTGVLIGAVTRGDEPLGHRDVTLSWTHEPGAGRDGSHTVTRTVRTLSGDGRYLACGIPRDVPITLRVNGTNKMATTRIGPREVVGIVDLPVAP